MRSTTKVVTSGCFGTWAIVEGVGGILWLVHRGAPVRGWILVLIASAAIFLAGLVLERLRKADRIGQRASLWGFVAASLGAVAGFLVAVRLYDIHLN